MSLVSAFERPTAERIITHYQSFTPESGLHTPTGGGGGAADKAGGRQKQRFFHTPEAGNKDVLTR